MTLPYTFRALRSRNYRLFFSGQSISLVGNWMSITTSSWLAYQLSSSAFYVGAVGFCSQIPLLLLSPFTGVLVDRINRHRLFILLQVMGLLQSATLAAFAFAGQMTIPVLLGLCGWRGLINAWDFPVRQSLMVAFVGRREDLPSGIAMSASVFNLARLVGPALAGFVIAQWGAAACYALDAASFLPVIVSLVAMRLPAHRMPAVATRPIADLVAGVRYVHHHRRLRTALAIVPIVALTGWAHAVLAPVVARELFDGDARLFGFMLSATGAGALAGALALGGRRAAAEGLEQVVLRGIMLIAIAQGVYAFSASLPVTLLALAAAGFGGVCAMAGNNTWVQSLVDDDKRGRVMGLFAMGHGMFPVGSLLIGAMAEVAGLRATLALASAICAATALFFARAHRAAREAATAAPPAALKVSRPCDCDEQP